MIRPFPSTDSITKNIIDGFTNIVVPLVENTEFRYDGEYHGEWTKKCRAKNCPK